MLILILMTSGLIDNRNKPGVYSSKPLSLKITIHVLLAVFHKIFNTIWGNLIKDNLIRQIVFGGHFLYSRDLHVCSRCYCREKLDAGLIKGQAT